MTAEVNINPNRPMNIRDEIKRCAILMEVKLQMHRDRDDEADRLGLRRTLQMRPQDWGNSQATVLTEGIQRNLRRIQESSDPFDIAHVSDAIDIMNYAMMICTTAWNGEGAGVPQQEAPNEPQTEQIVFPTVGNGEITHVGVWDASQIPDVTIYVIGDDPASFDNIILREDFFEETGINEDEHVIIAGREYIINANGRSARPHHLRDGAVAQEQPANTEQPEEPIF